MTKLQKVLGGFAMFLMLATLSAPFMLSGRCLVYDHTLGVLRWCEWATASLDGHQWGQHWYLPSEYQTTDGETVVGHTINCIGDTGRCVGF